MLSDKLDALSFGILLVKRNSLLLKEANEREEEKNVQGYVEVVIPHYSKVVFVTFSYGKVTF